jgi:hypothetical protein
MKVIRAKVKRKNHVEPIKRSLLERFEVVLAERERSWKAPIKETKLLKCQGLIWMKY